MHKGSIKLLLKCPGRTCGLHDLSIFCHVQDISRICSGHSQLRTQVYKFNQWSYRSIVVFQFKATPDWKLRMVNSIFHWISPLHLTFQKDKSYKDIVEDWFDVSCHFELCQYLLDGIEMIFFNQIRVIPLGNNPISPTTRCTWDSAVQCSSTGRGIFFPDICSSFWNSKLSSFSLDLLQLSRRLIPFPEIHLNNWNNIRCRSSIEARIRIGASQQVHLWNKNSHFSIRKEFLY